MEYDLALKQGLNLAKGVEASYVSLLQKERILIIIIKFTRDWAMSQPLHPQKEYRKDQQFQKMLMRQQDEILVSVQVRYEYGVSMPLQTK